MPKCRRTSKVDMILQDVGAMRSLMLESIVEKPKSKPAKLVIPKTNGCLGHMGRRAEYADDH